MQKRAAQLAVEADAAGFGPAAEPPRAARRVASRCWLKMAPARVSR
jgi:hypothetical protein